MPTIGCLQTESFHVQVFFEQIEIDIDQLVERNIPAVFWSVSRILFGVTDLTGIVVPRESEREIEKDRETEKERDFLLMCLCQPTSLKEMLMLIFLNEDLTWKKEDNAAKS